MGLFLYCLPCGPLHFKTVNYSQQHVFSQCFLVHVFPVNQLISQIAFIHFYDLHEEAQAYKYICFPDYAYQL